jgi:hypothetical protein
MDIPVYNILDSIPSLLTIAQDEIDVVISLEYKKHLSKKISKRSTCGLNYKSVLQFGLMIVNLIFQTIILYKEYNRD